MQRTYFLCPLLFEVGMRASHLWCVNASVFVLCAVSCALRAGRRPLFAVCCCWDVFYRCCILLLFVVCVLLGASFLCRQEDCFVCACFHCVICIVSLCVNARELHVASGSLRFVCCRMLCVVICEVDAEQLEVAEEKVEDEPLFAVCRHFDVPRDLVFL